MRYIILLSLFFIVLGCSNNDNDVVQEEEQEQNIELKIKKFTITAIYNNNWRLEYSFDEEAKPIQYFSTLDSINGVKVDILYNDLGQLTGVVGVLINEGQTTPWLHTVNEYNSSNELEKVNRFNENGSAFGLLTATHYQDSIQVEREFGEDGDTNYTLIFGANNLLIQENLESHAWNPNPTVTKYSYSNGNLININEDNGSNIYNINYEHDDKKNPLHPVLTRDYKTFILDDMGLSLAYNKTYSFSKNNITSYNDYGNLRVITYQYNDLGYPISAEVLVDGELIERFTYEYY
ncbi:hypothetical protein [Aequorivita sp. CIP111184]|uniref:hypothetical protein n=1 Tax=Aequorivita sp. CIP111184 TaxID=2211356 RepID=UPI000DBC41A4|nr:hypothetical protein [Aequorivita sp. CIP111184]SRX53923.1 hypothetical protein AEQU1_00986 [Aequorivita sp. CIP111184]